MSIIQSDIHNFIPQSDKILVQKVKSVKKTDSGIIIAQGNTDEDCIKGLVLKVGYEVNKDRNDNQMIHEGDHLVFSNYSGTKLYKNDDSEYIVVKAEDLLGIIPAKS